jgi:hypothetical protein
LLAAAKLLTKVAQFVAVTTPDVLTLATLVCPQPALPVPVLQKALVLVANVL